MKRILICIGIIILMNCSPGGGVDTRNWAVNMRCDQIDMRLDQMDFEVRKLKKRISSLEYTLTNTKERNEHLLQRIIVLETANLIN